MRYHTELTVHMHGSPIFQAWEFKYESAYRIHGLQFDINKKLIFSSSRSLIIVPHVVV